MRDGAVVARRAHNPKVVGSSPAPATRESRSAILLAFFIYQKLVGLIPFRNRKGVGSIPIAIGTAPATRISRSAILLTFYIFTNLIYRKGDTKYEAGSSLCNLKSTKSIVS